MFYYNSDCCPKASEVYLTYGSPNKRGTIISILLVMASEMLSDVTNGIY